MEEMEEEENAGLKVASGGCRRSEGLVSPVWKLKPDIVGLLIYCYGGSGYTYYTFSLFILRFQGCWQTKLMVI